ncbi:hypothetical protein [Paenarthrobacter sp. NPDC058040]|uniref:hypothetical protein n=1 Tax=unclassified Paenarthrobacter TaxID=2634190 RepID=UPI0036D928D3
MSISIAHRVLANAFGRRVVAPLDAAPAASESDGLSRQSTLMGQVTCSPWEGLYLDQAHTSSIADELVQDLESFLKSLVRGE